MILAVNPKEVFEYVSLTERHLPVDEQTIFKLQRLSPRLNAEVDNESIKVVGAGETSSTQITTGTQKLLTWKYGIKGWKNMKADPSDKEDVKWKSGNDDELEESIGRIPPNILDELYNVLRGNEELLRPQRERSEQLVKKAQMKGIKVA